MGLLDVLNTDEGRFNLGLLSAAAPRADNAGFGQRLNEAMGGQQEAFAALEREKQTLHGQLSEHRDRLQNLDGLLQDIQEKLRRGSDLARG